LVTVWERLQDLVAELPASELPVAERVLPALRQAASRSSSLDEAPLDDEPDRDDDDRGLTEARAEADRREGMNTDEVERRLGLR
jgi:hypothetical protein